LLANEESRKNAETDRMQLGFNARCRYRIPGNPDDVNVSMVRVTVSDPAAVSIQPDPQPEEGTLASGTLVAVGGHESHGVALTARIPYRDGVIRTADTIFDVVDHVQNDLKIELSDVEEGTGFSTQTQMLHPTPELQAIQDTTASSKPVAATNPMPPGPGNAI
jgi:hypothetical protein